MPARTRTHLPRASALALAACLVSSAALPAQQAASDPLGSNFADPPATAHPRVWWHWMNGNITKEGVTQDLDWMHRVGIVGFQNFDAALSTPKVVDQRLIYMQPGWQDAFRFAINKGDSLGFEMAIAGSPGWSETGGPWVKPEQAMKKVTWSVTTISGGQPFHGTLAEPPRQTGPFGNLSQQDLMNGMSGTDNSTVPDFGKDILVLALREPADDHPIASLHPTITTSAGAAADSERLFDHDLNQSLSFQASKAGEVSWVQYQFPEPVAIQSVTFAEGPPRDPLSLFRGESNDGPVLQSSTDGTTFTDVARFPTAGAVQHTLDFAPVTARFFRLAYTEKERNNSLAGIDPSDLGVKPETGPPMHHIAEFALHTSARVNRFEEKAAYAPTADLYGFATPAAAPSSVTPKSDVIDLTGKVKPDGTLDWTAPAGTWTIYRFGYSLTGITNHPAPPEATGPEVDKLNKADVTAYFNHYLDGYKSASNGDMGATAHSNPAAAPAPGGTPGKVGLQFVITDSWEAGTQNWTDTMLDDFQRLRGYDPRPWMPVLAGRVIGSAADSDRFLWDYRRTIAELLAVNHYGTLNAILHQRGMGQYGESHESGRATIGDGMEMKRYDDVPMAAMWTQKPGTTDDLPTPNADIRESASVAHIYGRPYVAAESMTAGPQAPWGWSPATLKPTADKELAMGLNRFVIHSSVHQPLVGPGDGDKGSPAPGLTLGPFGQWFNRNENWAEQASPWITYLSRASFMLQQGRFVADIAYFYGEDSNVTAIFEHHNPQLPEGNNFDFVNADILEHMLRVDHGDLTTASGMRYRVLVLDPYAVHMSLPVLRRIAELVRQGATVVGQAPKDDPSLADNQAEFTKLVHELWGDTSTPGTPRKIGKGRVVATSPADLVDSVTAAFNSIDIAPDTTYTKTSPDTEVLFVHRTLPGAEVFFVDNRSDRPLTTNASFRVTGRAAELFHPDTGAITPASFSSSNGQTTVPLSLEPWGTVFVVFRHPTTETNHALPRTTETELATLSGPWDVQFEDRTPKPEGEPRTLHMDHLASWSDSADPGVRYFTGHGTYTQHLQAEPAWLQSKAPVFLDLGDVRNLAEVTVNGKSLGIVWKTPFRVDVSSALKPGDNIITVRVANLWVNRLIGDAQPNAQKVTFITIHPYKADSPLVPAGLLGPVRLLRETPAP